MKVLTSLVLLLAVTASATPPSIGFLQIDVADSAHGLTFPAIVLYPATGDAAAQPFNLGPFSVNAVPGKPPAPGSFPVVLISHGRGGTNLGYFGIAERLVATGHIVALPLHHQDNYLDASASEADLTLELRPRHLSLTLDAIAASSLVGPHADTDHAAVIGHSMGGYTALAIAGGRPYTFDGKPVGTVPDPRVKALVLMAPATFWYDHDQGLSNVTTPILLLTAERDELTPGPQALGILRRSLPATTPLTHEVIPGAGHFAFLTPFPERMRSPDFPPANDPAGFDRAAFQRELPELILSFLETR